MSVQPKASEDAPKRLEVLGPAGETWKATATLRDQPGGRCRLRLTYADVDLEAEEGDYFDALCSIRIQMERRGHRVRCFGAARNVFPSGMARDMGAGLKAYKLRLGASTQMSDLVAIFDSAPDLDLATVDEQRAFYKEWLASVGARR